jgi:hypothetical protein
MTTNSSQPNHFARIVVGVVVGVVALYCDLFSGEAQRPVLQAALWTFFVFAVFAVELRKSLRRGFQQLVALTLAICHVVFLWSIRGVFPLKNSLFVIAYALTEFVVFLIIYLVAGQVLDPSGPFGLTEEDRKRQELRRSKRLL